MSIFASFLSGPLAVAVTTVIATVGISSAARAHVEQNMPPALAVMEYRILLEFKPDDHKIRLKFAAALEALKRFDEAEKEVNKVLTAEPDNFNGIDLMGLIRLGQGKTAESVKLFKKAIAIKPADVMVFYHLGLARIRMKEKAAARAAFSRAMANNRKSMGKNREKWRTMIMQAEKETAGTPQPVEKKP